MLKYNRLHISIGTLGNNPIVTGAISFSRTASVLLSFPPASGWIVVLFLMLWSGHGGGLLQGQSTVVVFTDPPASEEALRMAERVVRSTIRTVDQRQGVSSGLAGSLHQAGYLTAAIDSTTFSDDTLRVWVYCGPKINTSVTRISLTSTHADTLSREVLFVSSPGTLPAKALEGYSQELHRNGYPMARLTITHMEIAGDTLITTGSANLGRRYVWDTLEVRGDLSINNQVLQRLLRIRSGLPYDNILLTGIDRQLNALQFITRKGGYSLVLTEDGKARVVLPLDKRPASNFNGIIGFGPNAQDPQKLTLSGDVTLQLVNAFARAEELGMKWTGIQGDQQLTLQYRQPYLTFLPFGVMGRFKLFRKGEQYYTLNQRGGVMVTPAAGSLFTTWVQQTISRVLDRSVYSDATKLPSLTDYNTRLFGVEYRYQQLDFPANPSAGIYLQGELAGGNKQLMRSSDIPEGLFEGITTSYRHATGNLHMEVFIPITARWVVRPAWQVSGVYGNGNTENSLFLIGGINTIRGFDEQSIRASSYLLGALELRYRFEQESHFKVFLDGGWTEVKLTDTYHKDTPFGFGAGLTLPSPAGILQVSYAWGVQQGNPLDFRTGRLHFGLDARF